MIIQILVYGLEALIAFVPAYTGYSNGGSILTATFVWALLFGIMAKLTIRYVNGGEKEEQYDTIVVNNGLLHKVIESNGKITIYAHPKWAGDLQDVDNFLSEDLNSRNYVMGHSRNLKSTFKGMNVVFSNVRQ